jgi:hypothetical protein
LAIDWRCSLTAAGALGSGVCADNTTAQIKAIVERDCQQITPMAPAVPMPSSPCATAEGEECTALARAAACGQRLSPYSSAVRPASQRELGGPLGSFGGYFRARRRMTMWRVVWDGIVWGVLEQFRTGLRAVLCER